MEIKISTRHILAILKILSWIIFFGVSIEAGEFLYYAISTFFIEPDASGKWAKVYLSPLYKYDHGHFLVQLFFMITVAVMRAILFYLILKILHNNKISLAQPFNHDVRKFIINVAWLTLGIGLFSGWGIKYSEWLSKQGAEMPDIEYMRLGGADVWLFMCVTLFVIAHIYKRGIEIQTENELTV